MPEGPEVKIMVKYLSNNFKNKTLKNIEILDGRYKRHDVPFNYELFLEDLPLVIKSIKCHGKFIYWEFFNSDFVIFNTLGMEGKWTTSEDKHNNILFLINEKKLYLNDFRNFGTLKFCYKDELEEKLKELGPDILSDNNEFEEFKNRLEKKKKNIAEILLDQKVLAGVGNYLRAEGLYVAKINPFKKIKELTEEELKKLYEVLRQISWFNYDFKKGKKLKIIDDKYEIEKLYSKSDSYFLVYREKKDILGNKVVSEKLKDRTIFYVPEIQK